MFMRNQSHGKRNASLHSKVETLRSSKIDSVKGFRTQRSLKVNGFNSQA